MLSLVVGSDAFNLITIGGISLMRLELAVYRVCVYISLMTSGEFVRLCVLHILDNIFG